MSKKIEDSSITFIINTTKVGGAAKMLRYVSLLCADHFKKVTIISVFDDKTDGDDRINYIPLKIDQTKKGWRVRTAHRIRTILRHQRSDVLCAFVSDVAVLARIATIGLKIKYVSAERGDPYTQSFVWKLLTSWAYANSDFCFFQLDNARDFYGNRIKNKSFVIPNPYISESDAKPYTGKHKKTIVGVGRFETEKGFDVLIKAFKTVSEHYPEYRLIIHGDGSKRKDYEKLIYELELGEKVELPGYLNNVQEGIRKDGIFVLPSRYEGIPNALIEAMAIGLPCVATDCTPGGPAYLTDNGKRGLIVKIDDVQEMVKAIERIITNESLANELSLEAKKIVSILDRNSISQKWIEAFKVICGEQL